MVAITIRMRYLKAVTFLALAAVMLSLAVLAVLSARRSADGEGTVLLSNEDRVAFLNRCGWVVSEREESVRDVLIPSKWGTVYEEYNLLQKKQGFDLSDCRGMNAREYTYSVKNHPYSPDNVEAHLLLVDDRLVGGDVSCMELNGFMQGLVLGE